MRRSLKLFLFVVCLTACGSEAPDFTTPPSDFSFNEWCHSQVSGLPSMLVFEDDFKLLQDTINELGVEALDQYQTEVLRLLTASEPLRFNEVLVTPQRIGSLYEPGTTTIEELRQGAGVREVQLTARRAIRVRDATETGTLTERYDDSLNGHCDSFFEEDIRAACEAGDGTSCFRVNRIERRDFDIIAEACELAPYMLLCEPEDPPPYDLPRINES